MKYNSPPPESRAISARAKCLLLIFLGTIVMGPGPGVLLVNGKGPIFGMPAVYTWLVGWWIIQVSVVVVAYFTVWRKK